MTLRLMQELARSEEPARAGDATLAKLTPRERDVLAAIATGKTNKEIAQQLVPFGKHGQVPRALPPG